MSSATKSIGFAGSFSNVYPVKLQSNRVHPSHSTGSVILSNPKFSYKFPQKSRQEVAKMLGVEDLKQTRFYQEVFAEGKEEGKEEVLANMIELEMDLETIARCLNLPLEIVRQKANQKRD